MAKEEKNSRSIIKVLTPSKYCAATEMKCRVNAKPTTMAITATTIRIRGKKSRMKRKARIWSQ